MVQAYEQFKDQGVQFIALTDETDLDKDKIVQFSEDHGFNFPVGYAASELIQELNLVGYPTYYVFGKDGKLAWSAHSSGADLVQAIETALQAE